MSVKKNYFIIGALILILGFRVYLIIDKQHEKDLTTNNDDSENSINAQTIIDTDYPSYQDYKELYRFSDTVISSKIVSYKDEVINIVMSVEDIDLLDMTKEEKDDLKESSTEADYLPYRIFEVEVLENFKGSYQAGDVMQVKQLYGEFDQYLYENQALLEKEGKYLLFLEDYPNSPSSLLNENQAAYVIDTDLKSDEKLQPVLDSGHSFELTKELIREISEDTK